MIKIPTSSFVDTLRTSLSSVSVHHAPLIAYLAGVAILFLTLDIPRPDKPSSVVFLLAAIGSFAFTWSYMTLYFRWSFYHSAVAHSIDPSSWTTAHWLSSTSLFDEAWRWVCKGSERWWWSSQLCYFTVSTWSIFLWSQARRGIITSPWKYLLLGEILAISTASSLFLLILDQLPLDEMQLLNNKRPLQADVSLRWSILASLLSVLITPFTVSHSSFLPNLLSMHVFTVVLLLFTKRISPESEKEENPAGGVTRGISKVYLISALVSLVSQIRNTIATLPLIPPGLSFITFIQSVLWHHPAQSSISLDIVGVHCVWMIWIIIDYYRNRSFLLLSFPIVIILVISSPILSISTTLPLFLAYKEWKIENPVKHQHQ